MSGGVRNLRAMFENKDNSTSPPDRGRSPGESAGTITTPPRPLSKVRTSFIAVEKTAQQIGQGIQIGLRRQEDSGSQEPSMARRRTSFSIDEKEHPKETAERKESIAAEFKARRDSTLVTEAIPESALAETPALELDKQIGVPDAIPQRGRELGKPAEIKSTKKEEPKTSRSNSAARGTSANGTPKTASADKPATSKLASRPAPISTAKTSTAPKHSPRTTSPKSSKAAPKTPTTSTAPSASRSPSKEARAKTPEKKPTKDARKTPEMRPAKNTSSGSVATKTTTRSSSRPAVKTRIPPSPPQSGFNKPKPRSPTRPVQLPASLTAPTASSGSRTATSAPPARSVSRASGNAKSEAASHPPRSQSRAGTTGTKTPLVRSQSQASKTRPSLGPPPVIQKKTSRGSLPPTSAPIAEDGFLSRMMRPTASSASKTAGDKTPATPPRRSQSLKRPSTRDGTSKSADGKSATTAVPKVPKPALTVKPVARAKDGPKSATTPKSATATTLKSAPKEKAAPKEASKPEVQAKEEAPKEESTPAKAEEDIPAVGDATSETVPEPKEAVVEVAEPVVEEPVVAEEKVEAAPAPAQEEVEAPKVEAAAVVEPKVEAPVVAEAPKEVVDVDEEEDPEDAKVREEIARINAEMQAALLAGGEAK
ncbi:mucin-7 precursor protein [Rutstroemia sp. NJR-2017a WRK4]|nr:mucin-7 precursor protein [Rutstroemia sp. NJR-2017a WRK4]